MRCRGLTGTDQDRTGMAGRRHSRAAAEGCVMMAATCSSPSEAPGQRMSTDAPTNERTATQRGIRRSQGSVDEVFEVIRSDIMALRIPPDTGISIDELARKLGVSQTPIREALSRLEATGLVTKRHLFGYCCAPQLNRR